MTDRETRQRVIEILQKEKKTALHDNKWAFDYAINSLKIDLKYDLLYEETSGQADKAIEALEQEPNCSEIPTGSTTKDYLGVDCISRADAIHAVSEALKRTFVEYEDIANKVIGKLPSVTPQEPKSEWEHDHEILRAYADGANNVLDKLRAKIDKLYEREGSSFDRLNALDELKEFIDKYKAETENP